MISKNATSSNTNNTDQNGSPLFQTAVRMRFVFTSAMLDVGCVKESAHYL